MLTITVFYFSQMSTLKQSERNSIIEDFRNGIQNPDYEVIATKTKGKYMVRKRKVPLTEEQIEAPTEAWNVNTPVKRSKKENALFDLQNQLNTQLLYRLNDLTEKVTKLKAWKKKVKAKHNISDDEDVQDAQEPVQEPAQEPVQEPASTDYHDSIPTEYVNDENEAMQTTCYDSRSRIDYSKFGF